MNEELNQVDEILKCAESPKYFIEKYVYIFEAFSGNWIKFDLWPAQNDLLNLLVSNQLVITLKARQLGITWLGLSYALWLALFRPSAEILLFSRRDDEAIFLLEGRLKKMYKALPQWLQADRILTDNNHIYSLSNGSSIRAFPTTAGDSYTATFVMVDEADLVPDFNRLMRAIKPTIDNGGKLFLLSRADKDSPQSEFKKTYKMALKGDSTWKHIFLPWQVHPGRSLQWYADQKQDILQRTGSLDDLYEQYPNSSDEALLPKTLDKRIPGQWLLNNYHEIKLQSDNDNSVFEVFKKCDKLRTYVIGADPAEGNPTSDDSVAIVVDINTGEEVCVLAGHYQPQIFSAYLVILSEMYNSANILVERNNHGHAVILYLSENHDNVELLLGYDDKVGWLSNAYGKSKMWVEFIDYVRTNNLDIHNTITFEQLSNLDGKTLSAPKGEFDDYAMAFGLAQMARTLTSGSFSIEIIRGGSQLYVR